MRLFGIHNHRDQYIPHASLDQGKCDTPSYWQKNIILEGLFALIEVEFSRTEMCVAAGLWCVLKPAEAG